MTNPTRRRGLATTTARAATALAAAVLPLLATGTAHAVDTDDDDPTTGYPSTQSPAQGADAGAATVEDNARQYGDAADGEDRADGANGIETEPVQPDPRFLEGPLGGLLDDPLS